MKQSAPYPRNVHPRGKKAETARASRKVGARVSHPRGPPQTTPCEFVGRLEAISRKEGDTLSPVSRADEAIVPRARALSRERGISGTSRCRVRRVARDKLRARWLVRERG